MGYIMVIALKKCQEPLILALEISKLVIHTAIALNTDKFYPTEFKYKLHKHLN